MGHVIDFEQLKIENQTLNEKIEERHEELHKLRKKTVITVQVITHMREKLQLIARENAKLKAELARLDQELASQRDLVAKTKHERDDFRADNAKLRQQTGILNSDLLAKDYESRQALVRDMKQQIVELKQRQRKLPLLELHDLLLHVPHQRLSRLVVLGEEVGVEDAGLL